MEAWSKFKCPRCGAKTQAFHEHGEIPESVVCMADTKRVLSPYVGETYCGGVMNRSHLIRTSNPEGQAHGAD